ncbi:hypothetical protein [Brevibacillus fulvus]|uniref:Amidohydrolase-related domain-containing protein n=1 Tax=Brevibacillus fulvus TaxID=1125967 RepID=A0A938XRU9_9BACL|nr:hypothetical protein [Brevibacillus fulvus]MBM7588727.1 hypothetical protein [Brevibacillus fulvus]
MERFVLQGGTLVTAKGVFSADITVSQGKIEEVRRDQPRLKRLAVKNETPKIFDASQYYIVPGLIALTQIQPSRIVQTDKYIDTVRRYIQSGHTFLLDTIQIDEWMSGEQIFYQMAMHYNSPIDYGIQIGLDVSQFHAARLRELCRCGFRLFQVMIGQTADYGRIDWQQLYAVCDLYKPCIELKINENTIRTKEQRQAIVQNWLFDCIYGQVRTYSRDFAPFERISAYRSFYPVALLQGEESTKGWKYLREDWQRYFPAAAPLEAIRVKCGPKGYAEQLLCYLVRLASTNLAKIIGCYPRKGSLLPGADADFFLLRKEDWLTNTALSTILNFSEVCLPSYVLSKGRWICQDGNHAPSLGTGSALIRTKSYNYAM